MIDLINIYALLLESVSFLSVSKARGQTFRNMFEIQHVIQHVKNKLLERFTYRITLSYSPL